MTKPALSYLARSLATGARSRRASARSFEVRGADHRVGATADRQLGRIDAVGRQPRLDGSDHLDDRTRLPLRANAYFVVRPVERDGRTVEQSRQALQQPVCAG